MNWLKDGDRNTKFFHIYIKGRRKKLKIAEIQTEQGNVITTSEGIGAEAVTFLENQFEEDNN